jgi:Phosphoenolpyruvate phosphomutase
MKKATRFRQLIEAEGILVQPDVYDGFSARLVQQMGFKAGSISGAGLSESNLGWADVGLMGYEENLHASRAIAACADIPLSADEVGVAVCFDRGTDFLHAFLGGDHLLARHMTATLRPNLVFQHDAVDAGGFEPADNELMGLDTIKQMEQRFLTADQLAAKYGSAEQGA